VTGGRVRLAAGAQNDNGGHYVSATALYGSTENGLRTWDLRVGYLGDLYRLSIVRLGLDLELGYLVVHRATTNTRLWAMGLGAGAHVGVDVFSWGTRNDHAIVIEGRFDGHIHFGGSFMWGPTVMAGFRY